MSNLQVILIVLAVVSVLVALFFTYYKRIHMVDNFFVQHAVRGNSKFTHVTVLPYYTKGYYLQYHCGRDIYIVRDVTIDSIYGAAIQSIEDDVCWTLQLPKKSVVSEIVPPNVVVIKLKDKPKDES